MDQEDAVDWGPSGAVGGGNGNSSRSMGIRGAGQVTTFLSDVVLSWTMEQIKNDNTNKSKVIFFGSMSVFHNVLDFTTISCNTIYKTFENVRSFFFCETRVTTVPSVFNSNEQFQDTHHQLLIEETRAMLRNAVLNVTKSQVFHVDSVQACGLCYYYVDINLEKAASYEAECCHVAKDNDIFLLSLQSPLNPDFDMSSSRLGMAIKIGQDTFYQKNFTLLLSNNRLAEIEPGEMKFATFLSSLTIKMNISKVLSFDDKKNPAITAILNIQKMIEKRCAACNKFTKLTTDSQTVNSIVSSVTCVHGSQTQIICTPPGTEKHRLITEIVSALVERKLRILICFPSIAQIAEFLTEYDDYSDVLVLNSKHSLKNKSFHGLSLDHKSQQLFCCLTVWKAWMNEMACLLSLDTYYHTECQLPDECEKCKSKGLLVFSLASFTDRFDNVVGFLEDNLKYILEQLPKVCIPVCDLQMAKDLLDNIGQFKNLMHDNSLSENIVLTAFGLVAGSDLTTEDDGYTIAKKLDETRMKCISVIGILINSLRLPRLESRQEMDDFCMEHSLVIVSTPECTSQLYGVKMKPFHAFVVGDAGQINENELLIPFGLLLTHTVLLGDHKHIKPLVESQICEAAGYGTSLFQRLEPSKTYMLREQHQMHTSISQFPNEHFYEGKIVDGSKVDDVTYSEELKQLGLPHYAFFNIRAVDRRRHKGEITAQSAAIVMQIDRLHKVFMGTRLKVVVICLSRDEADRVRRQLRSIHKMYAKFYLEVKSIDSLQPG